MVGSSFLLLLLLGTRALPPEQAHVADALIHIGFDVSVTTFSVHRSTTATMEAVPLQSATP